MLLCTQVPLVSGEGSCNRNYTWDSKLTAHMASHHLYQVPPSLLFPPIDSGPEIKAFIINKNDK
jgi:hypothetical protein